MKLRQTPLTGSQFVSAPSLLASAFAEESMKADAYAHIKFKQPLFELWVDCRLGRIECLRDHLVCSVLILLDSGIHLEGWPEVICAPANMNRCQVKLV